MAQLHLSAERGARLLRAVSTPDGEPIASSHLFTNQDYQAALTEVRTRLSPEAFEAAWHDGQWLSLDDAIALLRRPSARSAQGLGWRW